MVKVKNSNWYSKLFILFLFIMLLVPINAEAATNDTNYYDISEYRSGTTFTHPEKEGYVFGGWYEDAGLTKRLPKSVTTGYAYAKFVDEEVLSVKCRLKVGVSEDAESVDLQMITTTDSLLYSRVGFKMQIKIGENRALQKTVQTKFVCETLTGYVDGENQQYTPDVFSQSSRYFLGYEEAFSSQYFSNPIRITPLWITTDGTTVEGTPKIFYLMDAIQVYNGKPVKVTTDDKTTYYGGFIEGVTAADAKEGDVTMTLLDDVAFDATAVADSGQGSATFQSSNNVTVDGGGYTITTTGALNSIEMKKASGTFTFKNATIYHNGTNAFMRVRNEAQVSLEDVNLYETSNAAGENATAFANYLFLVDGADSGTGATGEGYEYNLNMTRVNVTSINQTAATSANTAVIRLGQNDSSDNRATQTVTLAMEDCNIDLKQSSQRAAIRCMTSMTATINIDNTVIKTKDEFSIRPKSAILTYSDDCDFGSLAGYYDRNPIEGYVAKVNGQFFNSFSNAINYVNTLASENVTMELMADVGYSDESADTGDSAMDTAFSQITINNENATNIVIIGLGEGRSITTSGEENSIEIYQKNGTVTFENLTINHAGEKALMRVRKEATVNITDVIVYEQGNSSAVFNDYLFVVDGGEGTTAATGQTHAFNMTNVDVTSINGNTASNNAAAVLSLGVGGDYTAEQTVNVTMTGCNFDLDEATNRAAIAVKNKTKATITLEDTDIVTAATYAIIPNEATLTIAEDCALSSTSDTYSHHLIKECCAKIGNQYYSLTDAVATANASTEDVTIELFTDYGGDNRPTFDEIEINNVNSKNIILDGKGFIITTSGEDNSFEVKQSGGTVQLKNLKVYHNGTNAFMRVRGEASVEVADMDLYAIDGAAGVFQYYLFNISGDDGVNGLTHNFTMTGVNVQVQNENAADSVAAVVRTGSSSSYTRTVNIEMTDCDIDLLDAKDRAGIKIMGNTTATIQLNNTDIKTNNTYAIRPNGQSVVYDANSTLTSNTEYYQRIPVEGWLVKVADVWYDNLVDAINAADSASEDVTVTLYDDFTVTSTMTLDSTNGHNITIDGNGRTLTSEATNANHIFVVQKTAGSVKFEDMTISQAAEKYVLRIDSNIPVSLTDVTVNAYNKTGVIYFYYAASDTEFNLNLTNTNIVVTAEAITDADTRIGAIHMGGEGSERTINITMENSKIDVIAASSRYGVYITAGTTLNLEMSESKINTMDVYAICPYSTTAIANITLKGTGNEIIAENTAYNNDDLSIGGDGKSTVNTIE